MNSTSWFRRNTWYYKGKREYTKSAFEAANARFGEKELDVECSDRHFMITGATSKIGLATALEIAKRGGILHLVCRNATSMKEARSHIITTTGNDRIYQHQVNLADPKEVATWAEGYLNSYNSLDVVIHSASSMALDREETDEKITETSFAVNALAVHIITITLLPLLQRSPEPRVITVTNAGMLTVKLDPQDLNFEEMHPFDGRMAYLQTKRQQVVMNFCNAQRFERIKFFSVHPGWVDTPVTRSLLQTSYETMKSYLRTPSQGADTIIWLAISQEALKHSSGLFFQDRAPVPTHLPLAWTRSSAADEEQFMNRLDEHLLKFVNPELFQKSTEPPNDLQGGVEHKRSSENLLSEENAPQHLVPATTSTGASGQKLPPLTETEEKRENYDTQEELKLRVDRIANILETQERLIDEEQSTELRVERIANILETQERLMDEGKLTQDHLNPIITDNEVHTLIKHNTEHEDKDRYSLNVIEEQNAQSRDVAQLDPTSQEQVVPLGNSGNSAQIDPTSQEQIHTLDNSAHVLTSQEQVVLPNNCALDLTSQDQIHTLDNSAHVPTSQEQIVPNNSAQIEHVIIPDNSTLLRDKDSTKITNLDESNKEESSESCIGRQ